MFDLYLYPQWPTPFPRARLGTYEDIKELVSDIAFTGQEVSDMLDGKIIRERYSLELSPKTMRRLKVESIASAHPEGMTEKEIGNVLGCSENAVQKALTKALKRLRDNPDVRTLYSSVNSRTQSGSAITSKITCTVKYY